MGKIKIQNWNKMAVDIETWKIIVEQAKTQKEFWCHEKKKYPKTER